MRQAPIGVYPNERVLEKLLSKLRKICLQLVNTYCTAVCWGIRGKMNAIPG